MQLSPPSNTSAASSLPVLVPNILLLNRAIYHETQPVLYAGNIFSLEDTTALHAFLATIGCKNRATLTDLSIKGWGYTKAHKALNHPAFTMLTGAVNLSRLHLHCQIAWGGPKRVAKQLYRDGFHWLEAVGAARGKFDAAIELIEIPERNLNGYGYDDLSPDEKLEEFRTELRKLLRWCWIPTVMTVISFGFCQVLAEQMVFHRYNPWKCCDFKVTRRFPFASFGFLLGNTAIETAFFRCLPWRSYEGRMSMTDQYRGGSRWFPATLNTSPICPSFLRPTTTPIKVHFMTRLGDCVFGLGTVRVGPSA